MMAKTKTKKGPDYITAQLWPLALPIGDLLEDPSNARIHNEQNINAIKSSLQKFGQRKPVVLNKRSGIVLAGNGTLTAARALGWEYLATVIVDDDPATATGFSIADNRTAELAEWDDEVLARLLEAVEEEMPAVELGFTDEDLAELLNMDDGPIGEDVEPIEAPKDPVSKRGEVYDLGPHRLMCGDSTSEADVAALMCGEKAQMVFTDPPYGVNYTGGHFHSGDVRIKRSREKLEGDEGPSVYALFLPVVLPFVEGACYIWFAGSKALDIYSAVQENDCVIHAMIIWHKTNAKYAAMNSQYKQRHEPCLYFKKRGSTLRWSGPTDENTIWEIKRDASNTYHPTQKPIELACRAIGNHDAEIVADFFAGSGSTIIAAARQGRRCYGLEISPAYCDVIRKRWGDYARQNDLDPGKGAL